jgi:hypothetical protein
MPANFVKIDYRRPVRHDFRTRVRQTRHPDSEAVGKYIPIGTNGRRGLPDPGSAKVVDQHQIDSSVLPL